MNKRARTDDTLAHASAQVSTTAPSSLGGTAASSFRNVSACNRCRLRKNRCDQNLPACSSCDKAGVKCVGFDPITKREIPRTYVYYLESRLNYLESLLVDNGISFAPSQEFDLGSKPQSDQPHSPSERSTTSNAVVTSKNGDGGVEPAASQAVWGKKQDEAEKLNNLVSNIGMVSVQGTSDPRFLGSTSGISFARSAPCPYLELSR